MALPAAEPLGILIESTKVAKLGNASWEITMKLERCKWGVPLLGINGTTASSETDSMKSFQLTSSAVATVTRKQAASQSLHGTFSLAYEDKLIEGIIIVIH